MDKFVALANIDHYLDLLKNGDVSAQHRTAINKLLIEEENKLGHGREQLEFAESRAARCRDRADSEALAGLFRSGVERLGAGRKSPREFRDARAVR